MHSTLANPTHNQLPHLPYEDVVSEIIEEFRTAIRHDLPKTVLPPHCYDCLESQPLICNHLYAAFGKSPLAHQIKCLSCANLLSPPFLPGGFEEEETKMERN